MLKIMSFLRFFLVKLRKTEKNFKNKIKFCIQYMNMELSVGLLSIAECVPKHTAFGIVKISILQTSEFHPARG